MGFWEGQTRPYKRWDFKDQIWSQIGRTRREGEAKRKRKKKKRRRGAKVKPTRYGTLDFVGKLPLVMDYIRLCMNFHAWLVSSLSPNLGFC